MKQSLQNVYEKFGRQQFSGLRIIGVFSVILLIFQNLVEIMREKTWII